MNTWKLMVYLLYHRKYLRSEPDGVRAYLAEAVLTGGDRRGEWGDVGYYVAQTWTWLWWLYATITPESIINDAVQKFERRASPS